MACDNQQSRWPRGKVLGGSSSINYMQYVRGDPSDYDSWQLEEWSFEKMLPYFKKLEVADRKTIPENEKFRNHHHDKGVMHVTVTPEPNQIDRMFIEACEKNGFRETKDYNAEERLNWCVSISQTSTKNGNRWSTANGYLNNLSQRSNLDVLIDTHACRVEIDDSKCVKGFV